MDRFTIWTLIRAAILWFVVCAATSMLLYPGGTRLDRGTVAYVAVAWTPADRLPAEHVLAERTAFRSFLVASVLLGFVTSGSKAFTFRAAAAWWSFGALLLGFILIGIFGPSRRTEAGLIVQVVAQKVIVFSALVIVAFQSYEAQRAARRLEQPESLSPPQRAGALEVA